jgi:hypothetical protein
MAGTSGRVVWSSALGIVALLLFSGLALAEPVIQPYSHGMALGNGFNIYGSENKLACVQFVKEQSNPPGAIKHSEWYWDLVESNEDLMEKTGVNASASVSVGLASASVETSVVSENQLSSYDINVLSLVEVELRWDYTTQVRLKPEFETLLQNKPEEFLEKCGNYYVSGALYGGSFYNVINMSTTSKSDYDSVAVKVSGGYGPFAASVGVSNETKATLSQRRAAIKGYTSGSGGGGVPLTAEKMSQRVEAFPNEVLRSGGTLTQVILEEYPKLSASIDPKIWRMAMARWAFYSIRKEIDYLDGHRGQFYMDYNSWKNRIGQLKTEAKNAQDRLDQALAACRQNPKACTEPTGLRDPSLVRADLPPRYVGECGAQNLDMRNFMTTAIHPLRGRCGGDQEMAGNSPYITIKSDLQSMRGGKQVDQVTTVKMKESKHDWTCFNDSETRTLIPDMEKVFPGCYLIGNTIPVGTLDARAGNNDHEWRNYPGRNGIRSADCLSDTKGKDYMKVGCKKITFTDKIPVTLGHDEDKKGPNVYRPGAPPAAPAVAKAPVAPSKFTTARLKNLQKSTGKNVILPSNKVRLQTPGKFQILKQTVK